MEEAEAPKTLAFFFQLFLLMVKPYLFFFYGCACVQTDREIRAFFRSLIRRRGLEYIRKSKPKDEKEYTRLCHQYELKLFSLLRIAKHKMRKKHTT